MKKIMIALIILVVFAGFGWASDNDTTSSPDTIDSEVSVPPPDLNDSESSAATPSVKENESLSAPPELKESEAAPTPPEQLSSDGAVEAPEEESHSVGHVILLYIPNRIMDVFDMARLRVRVGPGVAVGVRATKLVSLFAGIYGSVFVGLPGPRLEPKISLPIGLENCAGVGVSLADLTTSGSTSPNYSNTEFGASVHAILVGVDVGVDPVEVLDLALGLLFIDIRGDDL